LAALLHGIAAAGVSQTLRRGTKNGITELSQRAPPIFGWAAITLGIGPHSSLLLLLTLKAIIRFTVAQRVDCRVNLIMPCSEVVQPMTKDAGL